MTQPSGGTVRSVKAKLEADASGYKRELISATGVTANLTKEISRLGSLSTQKAAEVAKAARIEEEAQQRRLVAAERLGRGMFIAGAGIAAGLGLAIKAAIEWESAWAGVAKTVDGSDAELAALEGELRELAATLPATHGEIAAVAEAAGQLGVATGDISAFTRTMIDLGEATNLTADQAATSIAQLMNVMGTAPGEVSNLGSALVELGNNGASTERDIIQMAQRISGAASIVGASESDVLALANALSSAGIEAEAGGSAISRVMIDMATSVEDGGAKLEEFARVAGVSANRFASQFATDPVAALDMFVQGLGRMNNAGEDVFGTLDQLGLSEIRTRDALLRLSSSGDLLTQSLADGARAWDENLALTEEAERRYETTAAKLAIARNQINDFAISMGETLLPIVGNVAEKLASFVTTLGNLPGPVKTALAVLGTATAALLLLGGATLIVIPRLVATKVALAELGITGASAAAGIRATGTALATSAVRVGPWVGAIIAAGAAMGLFAGKQKEFSGTAEEFRSTLDEQTGSITDNTTAMVANNLEKDGALEAARKLGISSQLVVDAVLGEAGAMDELMRQFRATDAEFDTLGLTQDEFLHAQRDLGASVARNREELGASQEAWAREAAAIGASSDAMRALDPAAQAMAASMGMNADEVSMLTGQVDELDKALQGLFDAMFGVEEAEDAAAQALRDLVEATQEHGTALEGNSEAALANRENVRGLIQSDMDLIAAMAEAGASAEELQGATEDLRQKFIDQMRQAGFSEEAIDRYAAAYDAIPSEVATRISTPGLTAAERDARNLRYAIDRIPRFVNVNVNISQSGSLPGIPGGRSPNVAFRHGGVIAARRGRLVPAHITESPTVLYGERGTGMEAFVPKFGSRARSLAIADTAARWHGGRVVDGQAVGGPWQWHGSRTAPAAATSSAGSGVDERGMARLVGQAVGQAINGARLIVDDRGRGRLEALTADRYVRGG